MNYRQTLDYLFAQLPIFQRVGGAAYRADLSNTIALCKILGHPENTFKSVHIAGTNGKGSTAHMIAAILQSAGYKTGLFTSPHLVDFRERIRINGKKIPKSYVTRFVGKNKRPFEPIHPSFFEYTAVLAFQYFSEEKVDVAIIETGMGGRLDSTNVITPMISAITNISMDHTAFLGSSLPEIAREKAGIIKKGIPVIVGETQSEVKDVFLSRSSEMKSAIYFSDQNYYLSKAFKGEYKISPRVSNTVTSDEVSISCPLTGIYQEKNFITTYQLVKQLIENGFQINDESIQTGFKNIVKLTGLQGRWQLLSRRPKIICDVGHNEAGIINILEQLASERFDHLHWVLGLVNDKDSDSILELLPSSAKYYFCKANIPRGLDERKLKDQAKAFGLKGKSYPSVKEAYQTAINSASNNDLVFIGCSTFVVAEVL